MFAPVLILGGIYGGIFTPTEAAGVACIYAVLVSVYIYRELTLGVTSGASCSIRRCLIGPDHDHRRRRRRLRLVDHHQRLPASSSASIDNMMSSRPGCCFWSSTCCCFSSAAFSSRRRPFSSWCRCWRPIVAKAGIDPIHFGLVVTVNLAIGMFLPPFGLNLFASNALFGTPLPVLYRGVLPFLLIYLGRADAADLCAGDHARAPGTFQIGGPEQPAIRRAARRNRVRWRPSAGRHRSTAAGQPSRLGPSTARDTMAGREIHNPKSSDPERHSFMCPAHNMG